MGSVSGGIARDCKPFAMPAFHQDETRNSPRPLYRISMRIRVILWEFWEIFGVSPEGPTSALRLFLTLAPKKARTLSAGCIWAGTSYSRTKGGGAESRSACAESRHSGTARCLAEGPAVCRR